MTTTTTASRDTLDVTLANAQDLRRGDTLLGWHDVADGWFILERDALGSRLVEWIVNTTTREDDQYGSEADFIWFEDGSVVRASATIDVFVVQRRYSKCAVIRADGEIAA